MQSMHAYIHNHSIPLFSTENILGILLLFESYYVKFKRKKWEEKEPRETWKSKSNPIDNGAKTKKAKKKVKRDFFGITPFPSQFMLHMKVSHVSSYRLLLCCGRCSYEFTIHIFTLVFAARTQKIIPKSGEQEASSFFACDKCESNPFIGPASPLLPFSPGVFHTLSYPMMHCMHLNIYIFHEK